MEWNCGSPCTVIHSPGIVNDVKFQYNFKGSEAIILFPKQQLELILIYTSDFVENCIDLKGTWRLWVWGMECDWLF